MDVEGRSTAEDAVVHRMALAEVSRSFEAVLEDVLQPPVAGLRAVQEHAKRTTEHTVLELKRRLEEDEKLLERRTRDLHDANISVNEMYGAGMGVLTRIENMLEAFDRRTGLLAAEMDKSKRPANKLFAFAGRSPRPSSSASWQRQTRESSSASSSSTNNIP